MSRTAKKAEEFESRLNTLKAEVINGSNEIILQAAYEAVHIQLFKLGYESTVQHTQPKQRGVYAICKSKLTNLKAGCHREAVAAESRIFYLTHDTETVLLAEREKLLKDEMLAELNGTAETRNAATKLHSGMLDTELLVALLEEETGRMIEYRNRLKRATLDDMFLDNARHYAIWLTGNKKLIKANDEELYDIESGNI